MTYEQCLAAIDGRQRFSPRPGLGRIARLLGRLGNPQERLRCIHVAGTNGKGSVCAMTERVLRCAGYRTGLFTSPYLIDFRERFQLCGGLIPKENLVRWTQNVLRVQETLEAQGFEPINSFELMTAIGFCYFAEQNCDFVVLETGLGGRCDPTNVIRTPAAVCITSVSLDHTAQLGDTVAQIGEEKAGIIKSGCTVVTPCTQAPEALSVIRAACTRTEAGFSMTKLPDVMGEDLSGTEIFYDGAAFHIPLLGRHQTENAACSIELCRLLGISDAAIAAGIRNCRWPGRLELVRRSPDILIDAGHNPAGMRTLCGALDTLFQGRSVTAIVGMMRDKDYSDCISRIAGRADRLIGVPVASPRTLTPDEVAAAARTCRNPIAAKTLMQAVEIALETLEPDDVLVICGSVYLAGEALQLFRKMP